MKALVINKYGGPEQLQFQDVPIPERKKKQILVRVNYAGLNPVDYKVRKGMIRLITGCKFPKILGGDIAGTVEQTELSSGFMLGQKVFAMLSLKGGGYAEYVSVKEKNLCIIPDNIDLEQAAGYPLAALTAYQAIKKCGGIRPNFRVLVNGASGGVGAFAVQLAKAMGATVTGVCSTQNVDFVKKLGASHVVDYTQQDFTKNGSKYHIIIDAVAKSSFSRCRKVLAKGGHYITTLPSIAIFINGLFNFSRTKKAKLIAVKPDGKDLAVIATYISKGLLRVNIQETFPLEKGAQAHQLLETERVRGKLVLDCINCRQPQS